ncbi:MAG: VOC family protein [Acidobacteria bacterium]|nr:VOC family protein [Acidobacteriota bacterium]MCG3194221.1 hypothetical protein [Thermoanaerobaculia bacterium]
MADVKPIPEGYTAITPYLVIANASEAIRFYEKAFGAKERFLMPGPGGKVMHAEIEIDGAIVMFSDEFPEWGQKSPLSLGGTPASLFLYVTDCDARFKQAVDAGAKPTMPPQDMFWGDRFSKVTDPFGHEWSIVTHIEDVSPEEMAKRGAEAMAQGCEGENK